VRSMKGAAMMAGCSKSTLSKYVNTAEKDKSRQRGCGCGGGCAGGGGCWRG
jgi:hypothetical protein